MHQTTQADQSRGSMILIGIGIVLFLALPGMIFVSGGNTHAVAGTSQLAVVLQSIEIETDDIQRWLGISSTLLIRALLGEN